MPPPPRSSPRCSRGRRKRSRFASGRSMIPEMPADTGRSFAFDLLGKLGGLALDEIRLVELGFVFLDEQVGVLDLLGTGGIEVVERGACILRAIGLERLEEPA